MAGTASAVETLHRSRGVVRIEVAIVTDASGDMTEVAIGDAFGRLVGVAYDGGLDASAVITLKDATGATILAYTTVSEGTPVFFRPTSVVVDKAGATLGAASANFPKTNRDIYVGGRLRLLVASGGNAETGKIAFLIDESDIGDIAATV